MLNYVTKPAPHRIPLREKSITFAPADKISSLGEATYSKLSELLCTLKFLTYHRTWN